MYLLRRSLSFVLFFSFVNILVGQEFDVQAGKKLFNANCAACHKLNKKAVGPALRGVSAKYDREWLYSCLLYTSDAADE